MSPSVTQVEPIENYQLQLRFENGETKLFDVTPYLDKGIFTELKNQDYFKKVRIAFGSIEWPNEQDFSKDTLYILGTSIDA